MTRGEHRYLVPIGPHTSAELRLPADLTADEAELLKRWVDFIAGVTPPPVIVGPAPAAEGGAA